MRFPHLEIVPGLFIHSKCDWLQKRFFWKHTMRQTDHTPPTCIKEHTNTPPTCPKELSHASRRYLSLPRSNFPCRLIKFHRITWCKERYRILDPAILISHLRITSHAFNYNVPSWYQHVFYFQRFATFNDGHFRPLYDIRSRLIFRITKNCHKTLFLSWEFRLHLARCGSAQHGFCGRFVADYFTT